MEMQAASSLSLCIYTVYLYKNRRSFLQAVWAVGAARSLGAGATWLEKTRKNSIKRCAGVLGSHLGARERCAGVLGSHLGARDRCAGVFGSHWGARERLRRRAQGPLWCSKNLFRKTVSASTCPCTTSL